MLMHLSSDLVLALNEQVQDILTDLVIVLIEELVNLHPKLLDYDLIVIQHSYPPQVKLVIAKYLCTTIHFISMPAAQ